MELHVLSDSYMGLDHTIPLQFTVTTSLLSSSSSSSSSSLTHLSNILTYPYPVYTPTLSSRRPCRYPPPPPLRPLLDTVLIPTLP